MKLVVDMNLSPDYVMVYELLHLERSMSLPFESVSNGTCLGRSPDLSPLWAPL
jgi:hypothetical protein